MRGKRGQQEIAGFVIIVVLVIVAIMVFIVISLKQEPPEVKSDFAQNVLSSIMSYTSNCVVSQPYLDSIRDLVKHCYENQKCNNLNEMACTYLNETLTNMLPDLILNPQVSGTMTAYELKMDLISSEDESDIQNRLRVMRGVCNQTSSIVTSAEEIVDVSEGTIVLRLKVCSEI